MSDQGSTRGDEDKRFTWAHYMTEHSNVRQGLLDFASASLKTLLILNGGALVALLALKGNMPELSAARVFGPAVLLTVGAAMVALAQIAGYVIQELHLHQLFVRLNSDDPNVLSPEDHRTVLRSTNLAHYLNVAALGCALLSLALFLGGALWAAAGLSTAT